MSRPFGLAGFYHGLLPGIDYTLRLSALSGIAFAAAVVAVLLRRESDRRVVSEERARLGEQEAIKQERILSTILDNAQGRVYMRDADGRCLYVNGEVERQFGRSRDGILNRTNDDLFPPEVARQVNEFDREVFTRGSMVEREEGCRQHQARKVFFFTARFSCIARGKPAALSEFPSVSRSKRRRSATCVSSLRTPSIVVARIDSKGIIEWSTPAVTTLLGWYPEQLKGRPFLEFIHPSGRQRCRRRAFAACSSWSCGATGRACQTARGSIPLDPSQPACAL